LFCGILVTNITVQGPPTSIVPYILTDAIRHHMQRRYSVTNKVKVEYWDRGLRMANLGLRLHGKQSEITSLESIDRFQDTVVDFLNDSKLLTTDISSALIFDQKLIGEAGEGDGDLLEDTLTVKAAVFGQAALYTRENYTATLLSAFDEYPDIFLGRLTGEQGNSDARDAFEVFAVAAPSGTTNPTMSPVAMETVAMIDTNTIETSVKAQPNLSFIITTILIVACLLSSATGFAVYKRNQKRTLKEKEAVDAPPVSAPSPV
jgi:hypothetical protein